MNCKYKNLFGNLREGLHSYRIGKFAIFDIVTTLCLASIVKYIYPDTNIILILILLFIMGIIAHRVFCVRTPIDVMIFG